MVETDHARQLRELVRLFIRKLGVLEKGEASCCGITVGQCHVLVEIAKTGETTLNALAEELNLDKSTMSRTLNNMVDNDLVSRLTDPEDRRYLNIQLSPQGKKVYEEIESRMEAYFQNVVAAIPEQKRGQVLESLQLLLQALDRHQCC